tara:strand:+ start:67 stop:774 length:708 start_codon:yes stop_codon:yes gene_type:complete
MIIPIIPNELFRVNPNIEPYFEDGVIYIDNYYANYERIYEVLQHMPIPRFKWGEKSRNFIDYYDCRPKISNEKPTQLHDYEINQLRRIIRSFFGIDKGKLLFMPGKDYEFNYLKHIKLPKDINWQAHPHFDVDYGSIVFLDKICSGGTALYPDLKEIPMLDSEDLFIDVSGFKRKLIKAKPNRHIIFSGTGFHGAYIDDHTKYLNDWRINQVRFFNMKGSMSSKALGVDFDRDYE